MQVTSLKELKQHEKITARFGDILSSMYLLSATLRRYRAENSEDDDFIKYIGDAQLRIIQNAFNEIAANLFEKGILKILFTPFKYYMKLNSLSCEVDDTLSKKLSDSISTNSEMRDKLVDGIYHSSTYKNIQVAFKLHEKVAPSMKKIKIAIRKKQLPKQNIYKSLDEALRLDIISVEEKKALFEAKSLQESVVQVDGFTLEDYFARNG